MDENENETPTYLTPYEVMEEAQDFRERLLRRQINDEYMTQTFAYRVERPDPQGRIPLTQYGLHKLNDILRNRAQPMYGRGEENKVIQKDVLDTAFTSGQGGGALARQIQARHTSNSM